MHEPNLRNKFYPLNFYKHDLVGLGGRLSTYWHLCLNFLLMIHLQRLLMIGYLGRRSLFQVLSFRMEACFIIIINIINFMKFGQHLFSNINEISK